MKLICKNMTHAMKANKLLYKYGIYSKVEKVSGHSDIKGCAYSIVFDSKYLKDVLIILKDGGVLLHKYDQNVYGDV